MTIAQFFNSTVATQNKFTLDTSGQDYILGINPNAVTGGSSSTYGPTTTTIINTAKGTYTEVTSSKTLFDPYSQTYAKLYSLSMAFSGQTIFTYTSMPGDPDLQGVAYMGYVFSGNDELYGGSGDDNLYGWNGNDSLTGASGNDFIDGGNGTDYAYFADKYGECSISFNGVTFSVATKTQGTDTLKNVEFAVFGDYTYNLSEFYKPPTYTLTATSKSFNEGGNAVFNLTTTKVPAGTALTYTISGISKSDLTTGGLTGTTIVGADGKSVISIPIYSDRLTEGTETIAVTIQGSTGYASIIDTSVGKGPAASDLVYVFKSEKTGPTVNPASYSYYYTSDVDEVNYINAQANWPWVQKPSTFEAAHSNPALATPVFKFWSDKLQAPYFTISTAERDQIISWSATGKNGYDWKYAGTGFSVYTSAAPTDEMGKNAIPVFCVWMDDTDFNPTNGLSGGLLFTANKTEYEGLVKLVGVTGAGVVFYGEVPGN
jgi:hypothetical protein